MAHKKCDDEAILDFIRAYQARRGYPPTKREIGEGCGIVVSAMEACKISPLSHFLARFSLSIV